MKQKLSKNITYWLGVTAIGLIVGLSIQFVQAWTEPPVGTIPPANNVGAPINVSNTGQSKAGNLLLNSSGTWANGLIVANGRVGIGTAGPGYKLDVAGGDINVSGVYRKGGTAGVSATCGAGNTPSGITVSGGIITSAGGCAAIGGGGGGGDITDVFGGTGISVANSAGPQPTVSVKNNAFSCGAVNQSLKTLNIDTGAVTCEVDDVGAAGGIGGSGTANYVAKFTAAATIGNSQIFDNGANVGIGTASPGQKLDVQGGNIRTSNNLSTNNFSPTLPNGWNGIHTNDLHARWSIRTQNLCLGGGGGGDAVGDCRSAWPGGGSLSCVTKTCIGTYYGCTITCDAGYTATGGAAIGRWSGGSYDFPLMNYPSDNGWFGAPLTNDMDVKVYVRCCKIQ